MKLFVTSVLVFIGSLLSFNVNAQCFGGQIFTNDFATTIDLCTDLPASTQPLFTTGIVNNSYDYVITDENNIITSILSGSEISLANLTGSGSVITESGSVTRIWGFSYTGERIADVGDLVWGLAYSDDCYNISSNAITVNPVEVDGGSLSTEDGTDEIFICLNDNVNDVIGFFNDSNSSGKYTYLLTTEDNKLLSSSKNSFLDFTFFPIGKCKLWGLSHTGNLTISTNMDIFENPLTDGCSDLSDNSILVDKDYVEGAQIFSSTGLSHVFIEVGDSIPDEITYVTNTWAAPNYVYVITDVTNTIIEISESDTKDFENTGPGINRIWGFAYTGEILANVGDPVFGTRFSTGCFDITDNALQIEKTGEGGNVVGGGDVDGGTIGVDGGGSFQVLCPEDVNEDQIMMNNNSSASSFYSYLITDENDNIITFTETASIMLSAFLPGSLRIWGISHEGELDIAQGSNIITTNLSSEPYELSANFVTVIISIPEAHELVSNVGEDGIVCGGSDGIIVEHTDQVIGNIDYLITDENNIIVAIDENSPVNFPEGLVGRIYGVAHFDPLTVQIGDDLSDALSEGCFDVTDNFISINAVEEVDGGLVSIIDGTNAISICGNDGTPDLLTYQNNTTSSANYGYIITDIFGNILAFIIGNSTDFDSAIPDTYRVYGYSFTGTVSAGPGDNIDGVLTDGCFDVSSNFVEVVSTATFGGAIFLEDETTSTTLCGSFFNNEIPIVVNTTSTANYGFVVTDASGIIVDVSPDNPYVFDPATPAGNYNIFGYSYSGDLQAPIGEEIFTAQISDGCFQQSFTFINVLIDDTVLGGIISTMDGLAMDTICVQDELEDVISFQSTTEFGGDYVYLIVNEEGVIMELLDVSDTSFDFNALGLTTSTIYGVAYTGDLMVSEGDIIDGAIFSNGCSDTSNSITIVAVNEGASCEPGLPEGNTQSRITDNTDNHSNTIKYWEVNATPNPIQNELTIRLDKLDDAYVSGTMRVIDMTGRIMYQAQFDNAESILLETSDWHSGIYLLTFEAEVEMITKKLLKQ